MNEGVDPHETVVVVKRILVPIDRSEYKEKIAAYAISLAKAWGAEMTAVHVIEPRNGLPDGVEAEAKEQSRIDESKRQTENLLNEIGILTKKQGLNIKKEAIQPPDLLAKKHAPLIVSIHFSPDNYLAAIVILSKLLFYVRYTSSYIKRKKGATGVWLCTWHMLSMRIQAEVINLSKLGSIVISHSLGSFYNYRQLLFIDRKDQPLRAVEGFQILWRMPSIT